MNRIARLAALAALGFAAAAHADVTVVGTAGAGWQNFPGALNQYSNTARPFWDQRSLDTGNRNIGNYLNGSYTLPLPGGTSASPNISPRWWGAGTPGMIGGQTFTGDSNFRFAQTASTPSITTTMHLEVAGNNAFNEVGWYNTTDPKGAETLHPIYSGANVPILNGSFTPSAAWGLYIRSFPQHSGAGQGLLFFSESMRNRANGPAALASDDLLVQHFALFGVNTTPGNERYYVGIEDLAQRSTGIEKWGDYNDVVMTIQAVPAPGAMVLAALGGLLVARRRR